jgi:hypothetical protein
MSGPDSLPHLDIRTQHVRTQRLLVNLLAPTLAIALALFVFHGVFPYFFSVLVWLWTVEGLLLVALAVLWVLGSWAFASGKIRCPGCAAAFSPGFHVWIPKTCHACGYDVTLGPGRTHFRRSKYQS